MNKINKILIFILLLFSITSYSQIEYKTTNYYLVDSYFLYINYSNDSEIFKDILPDETILKNLVNYKTGLKYITGYKDYNNEWYKCITIMMDYNIKKNPYETDQYFGYYELRVFRVLPIPKSDYITNPHAQIFSTMFTFVYNNPVKSTLKAEIEENIFNLINEFALDYKSSF